MHAFGQRGSTALVLMWGLSVTALMPQWQSRALPRRLCDLQSLKFYYLALCKKIANPWNQSIPMKKKYSSTLWIQLEPMQRKIRWKKENNINVLPIWFIKIQTPQFLKSGMAHGKSYKNKLLLSLILYWCRGLWWLIESRPGQVF